MIIGYTTGVFDLFHIGHLNILKKAKEMCDYLIVGVSTDELVMQYKNKTPVICYEERAEIVRSIKYVDKVVPQVDRDKFAAFEKYGFNRMFVGDDWKGSPLFSSLEEKFKAYGVEIVYFPYTKGTSSTMLKQALNAITTKDPAFKPIRLQGEFKNESSLLYKGVRRTFVQTGADSPYGPNKINIVQFDPKNEDLRVDVMPCKTYANELDVVTSLCERVNNEKDYTPIAAINGDLWMVSYAHARIQGKGTSYGGCSDDVVKKSMTTPRGFNIYDGEIISTGHIEKETPFEGEFWSFGFTAEGKCVMGEPTAQISVKNVTQNVCVCPDGLNRLPANDALIMYTDRLLSSNDYALDDAYEVRVVTKEDYTVSHGAVIKGTVDRIFSANDEDNPEKITEKQIVLTARGSAIGSIESFKVGDEIEISVNVIDLADIDTPSWQRVRNAVGGHICFAKGGVDTGENPSCNYPATIIGIDKSGMAAFITMDGRRDDSIGSNPKNLPYLMRDLDLYDAFLVDGGGSATLVSRQADGSYKVINTPCDPGDEPRSVINAVVLSARKKI